MSWLKFLKGLRGIVVVIILFHGESIHAAAVPVSLASSSCTPCKVTKTTTKTSTWTDTITDNPSYVYKYSTESTRTIFALERSFTYPTVTRTVFAKTTATAITFIDNKSTTIAVCPTTTFSIRYPGDIQKEKRAVTTSESCNCSSTSTISSTVTYVEETHTVKPGSTYTQYYYFTGTTHVATATTTVTAPVFVFHTKYEIFKQVSRATIYPNAVTATLAPFPTQRGGQFRLQVEASRPGILKYDGNYIAEINNHFMDVFDDEDPYGSSYLSTNYLSLVPDLNSSSVFQLVNSSVITLPSENATCSNVEFAVAGSEWGPPFTVYDWVHCYPNYDFGGYYTEHGFEGEDYSYYGYETELGFCEIDCHGYLICFGFDDGTLVRFDWWILYYAEYGHFLSRGVGHFPDGLDEQNAYVKLKVRPVK